MKLPPYMTTVTPLSKSIALFLFTLMPIAGFFVGMWYQQAIDTGNTNHIPQLTFKTAKKSVSVSPSMSQSSTATPALAQPVTQDMTQWKRYSNDKYSFKYPPEAAIQTSKTCPPMPEDYASLFFNGKPYGCGTDASKPVTIRLEEQPVSLVNLQVLENKTINVATKEISYRQMKFTGEYNHGQEFIHVEIQLNDKTLQIDLNQLEYKDVFDKVLATFTFKN